MSVERPMSTARRALKRSAVSESNDDKHDVIDLCSVSLGDVAVRVAAGGAVTVSDASVYSESEERDSGNDAEGTRTVPYSRCWLICFLTQACLCRCSCARV